MNGPIDNAHYLLKFAILSLVGLGASLFGPFVFIGPILGFPVVLTSAAITAFVISDKHSYLDQVLLSFLPVLLLFLICLGNKGLDLIAVGMLLHVLGIILYSLFAPYILKIMLKEQKKT